MSSKKKRTSALKAKKRYLGLKAVPVKKLSFSSSGLVRIFESMDDGYATSRVAESIRAHGDPDAESSSIRSISQNSQSAESRPARRDVARIAPAEVPSAG